MATHTPGPWRAVGRTVMAGDKAVCDCIYDGRDGGEAAVNAELIVQACNNHEALLEALMELSRIAYQMNALQHAGIGNEPGAWAQLYQATNEAKAAIAKAEGRA